MKTTIGFLAAGFFVVPALAADLPGFAMWRAGELKQRNEALSKKVGPDHSARETLAKYNDHRFRLLTQTPTESLSSTAATSSMSSSCRAAKAHCCWEGK